MLVAIGKGIEIDVDVARFNSKVHDHIVRTGLRNLLMDAHASATAKANPDNYIQRSRELAEKKLALCEWRMSEGQRLRPIQFHKSSFGLPAGPFKRTMRRSLRPLRRINAWPC